VSRGLLGEQNGDGPIGRDHGGQGRGRSSGPRLDARVRVRDVIGGRAGIYSADLYEDINIFFGLNPPLRSRLAWPGTRKLVAKSFWDFGGRQMDATFSSASWSRSYMGAERPACQTERCFRHQLPV
jgi:hypothetical protein